MGAGRRARRHSPRPRESRADVGPTARTAPRRPAGSRLDDAGTVFGRRGPRPSLLRGCEYVDVAERLAIKRVKALFNGDYANVQPHAGAQANAAVFLGLVNPGDTVMGMNLTQGGHLTHGNPANSRAVITTLSLTDWTCRRGFSTTTRWNVSPSKLAPRC